MAQIHSDQHGHVLTLTIDNADRRNAVSEEMLARIEQIMVELDPLSARCVVLRGAEDKAFCSGYDLSALPVDAQDGADFAGPEQLHAASSAIAACPVPTIAWLKGACFGAGGELAAACDLRLAADDLKFGMPPAKLGIVYHQDGLQRFVRLLGESATKWLFFTSRTIHAQEALQMGLVNVVFTADAFFDQAGSIADIIASRAPLAVTGMKKIIDAAALGPFADADRQHFDALRKAAFSSDDYREGMAAMAEKRSPRFSGR